MSSNDSNSSKPSTVWNVPNVLSASRIVMALVCFVALELRLFPAGLALYVIATATDWLDGYWARRFGQVTQLGRILDPFADKLLVCGAFVYLAAIPDGGVAPWMAVVVLSRELLVTALRSFVESSGGDFSAKWVGKWKMAFQCAVVIVGLYRLIDSAPQPAWLPATFQVTLWLAVALTVYSGASYVISAVAMSRKTA